MAVVQLTEYLFIGLNGDARPATPTKGAQYIAYDTGGNEYYDGTAWRAISGGYQVNTELPTAAALADGTANPTAPMIGAGMMVWNGATWDLVDGVNTGAVRAAIYGNGSGAGDTAIRAISNAADGYADSRNRLEIIAVHMQYNGASWDRQRTPAATAETTIWTPTSGKKFRLMGFILTCEAASLLTFRDNTGGTTIFETRGGTDVPISPPAMGNGILSAAANNVLTVTRGTSVALRGTVWGTEE
jgi:hypothetical protein